MRTHSNEILVYCNPNSSTARKVLALARTISPNIRAVEYHKTPFTTTIWQQILYALNLRPKDLMNRAHPYYQENIRGRDFNLEGWLRILMNNPDIIKAPIVIKGNKAILCNNPTDIYRL